MMYAGRSRSLAGRMYCLSFRHHPTLHFKLVKCKYWLPRCTTEGSSRPLKVMESGSLWGPLDGWEWNDMHNVSYGNQLRTQLRMFTPCDKWVGLWWVRENKIRAVSHTLLSNTNALTYFISLYREKRGGGQYGKLSPLSSSLLSSGWFLGETLTLKAHEVAGLFGLAPDDTNTVLQTQYALRRMETRGHMVKYSAI